MTVHPTPDDLDRYLHRAHAPADTDVLRRHLDACTPCWNRWNAHRWATARHHRLHQQLADYLGSAFRPGHDSSRALAAAWDRADPRTPDDVAAFFRSSSDYLYNLVVWEASGHRPRYLDAALPALRSTGVRTVLDIGSGIGSDAVALLELGFTVTTCDHDSPSTRFAEHRHGDAVRRINPEDLGPEHAADALWIIDTLDHLADPARVLAGLLAQATIVVTEDIHEDRAHGRQRFHHRRPVQETVRLFARHGLEPTLAKSVVTWKRRTRPT